MEMYLIAFVIIILLIAVVLFIRRPQGGSNPREVELLRKDKETAVLQLARAEQQVESLAAEKERVTLLLREEQQRLHDELQDTRRQLAEAERSLESARARYQSQQELLEAQKEEIAAIRKQFNAEFQVIANTILAEQTLTLTGTHSLSLDQNLIQPKDTLKTSEEKV